MEPESMKQVHAPVRMELRMSTVVRSASAHSAARDPLICTPNRPDLVSRFLKLELSIHENERLVYCPRFRRARSVARPAGPGLASAGSTSDFQLS
ncbi:hypothetical protein ACVIJ6_001314 [Bradyrhizobium sp. USDA 4369]